MLWFLPPIIAVYSRLFDFLLLRAFPLWALKYGFLPSFLYPSSALLLVYFSSWRWRNLPKMFVGKIVNNNNNDNNNPPSPPPPQKKKKKKTTFNWLQSASNKSV